MTASAADILIATLQKNSREEFRVQLRTFKGHRSIDVRVFASNGVELAPTAKGVSIKPELMRPIIEAMQRAEQAAIGEGLLPASDIAVGEAAEMGGKPT